MLLTTQLIIQYNPKWITKIEKGRKFSGKKQKIFGRKVRKKAKNILFFALFAIQKMA